MMRYAGHVPPGDGYTRRGAHLPRQARIGLLAVVAIAAAVGGPVYEARPASSVEARAADARCSTVADCRRAIDWWKAQTRRVAHERLRTAYPRLREAALLAGRAFGVDPWAMLRVARCESTSTGVERWVSARNGATAMGAWQWLDSTWAHSPFAALDRRNVFTEAVATAWLVSRDGWRQWVCQP